MYSNLTKNIQKIVLAFDSIDKMPKSVIRYGTQIALAILSIGTLMVVLNHTVLEYDTYFEFIATSIVKSSFTILAEVIIGALVLDYVFKKN